MNAEYLKLDDDETVLLTVRKHWFILFVKIFLFAFCALIPLAVIAAVLATDVREALNIEDIPLSGPSVFFSAAWFLIMWMMIFSVWTDFYLDMWIVTTKRIIAIDQRGLFHRSVSSFRLERLQDLHVHVNGIIATALNFGTLEAETASHEEEFIIYGVPRPQEIKATIQEYADRLMPSTPIGTPRGERSST